MAATSQEIELEIVELEDSLSKARDEIRTLEEDVSAIEHAIKEARWRLLVSKGPQ